MISKNKFIETSRLKKAIEVLRDYRPEQGTHTSFQVSNTINFLEGKILRIDACKKKNWFECIKSEYSCEEELWPEVKE